MRVAWKVSHLPLGSPGVGDRARRALGLTICRRRVHFPSVNSPDSPKHISLGGFILSSQFLTKCGQRDPVDLLELCCCGFVLQYFGLQSFADKPQQKTDQKSSSDEAGNGLLFTPKNPFPVHSLPKGTVGLLGTYSRVGLTKFLGVSASRKLNQCLMDVTLTERSQLHEMGFHLSDVQN